MMEEHNAGDNRSRGYIHVYTGNGKGKTTAAFGLALRAAGAGLRVYIAQFAKKRDSGEIKALGSIAPAVCIKQYGKPSFVPSPPGSEDIRSARAGLKEAAEVMDRGAYDMIILDEVLFAVSCGLIRKQALLDFMDAKPAETELILTGRNADAEVIEKADLVTEMKEIKHYFSMGVPARRGIEQ